MVDTLVLGTSASGCVGSSPIFGILNLKELRFFCTKNLQLTATSLLLLILLLILLFLVCLAPTTLCYFENEMVFLMVFWGRCDLILRHSQRHYLRLVIQ